MAVLTQCMLQEALCASATAALDRPQTGTKACIYVINSSNDCVYGADLCAQPAPVKFSSPVLQAHDSSAGSLSVNAVLACARNYAALWLRHKNPFIDHTQEPSGDTAVLTFEVAFSDVVGMDFRWPLTVEPRLVLEASCLCKRVFNSVSYIRVAAAVGACAQHLGHGACST